MTHLRRLIRPDGGPRTAASPGRSPTAKRFPRDHGSAVVDFVMVGALLVFMFLALVQLALTIHVRNVLTDSAVQGALLAARSDLATGRSRTQHLIVEELADSYADQVTARTVQGPGAALIEVEVRAPIPVVGLVGVGRTLTVTGHALVEAP